MPCPICFERDIEQRIVLTECGHEFCRSCIEAWILRQEGNSSDPEPNCPECRLRLSDDAIASILGRPLRRFQRPSVPVPEGEDEVPEGCGDDGNYFEPDDFTRVYLETLESEGTARRCPSCRAWIILGGGCNNVMCRCGCRFCFCCGKRGTCMGYTFFDNLLGREDRESFYGREFTEPADYMEPIFEGDYWFAEEEDAREIDITQFDVEYLWLPIETEEEGTLISPLFDGPYWECSGRCDEAHPGINDIFEMWREIMESVDPWEGDAGEGCFGAYLFS